LGAQHDPLTIALDEIDRATPFARKAHLKDGVFVGALFTGS
jgi:hypothetical protein